MSPVKQIIQSRINSLKELSDGFDAITHHTTKGTLRENGLIEFFKGIIPQKFSISSGIVCDSLGSMSNQTDFIVYDRDLLPPLLLSSDISLIPVDSVYLIAEIKSNLRTKDLKQIILARENFNKLKLSSLNKDINIIIPTVVLAYASDISEKYLMTWMKNNNDVVSICIIDSYTLSKEQDKIQKHAYSPENKCSNEVLTFSHQLFNYLATEIEKPRPKPIWEAYVIGAREFADKNDLKIT